MLFRNSLRFAILLGIASASAESRSIRFPLITDARGASPSTWHYTTVDPGEGWADTGFSDEGWQTGTGGFGSGTPENAHINTDWSTGQIWLRASFALPEAALASAALSLYHDDDVQVFLNGKPVFQEASWVNNYQDPVLPEDFLASLKPGKNVLAITCINTDGPGYVDAGLSVTADFESVTLAGDARSAAPADWSYTTSDPGPDWSNPGFDASAWQPGKGLFGATPAFTVATDWQDADIWLRAGFQLAAKPSRFALSFLHDDGLEVFVNGTQVLQAPGWNGDYEETLADAVAGAAVIGKNTLAVHCHNDQGPQFVDVGLYALDQPVPTGLRSRRPPASGRGPALLLDAGSRADLGLLRAASPGRLSVFGADGRVLASVQGGPPARYLTLPVTLGTGVFRYRWDSPRGIVQGTLLKLP